MENWQEIENEAETKLTIIVEQLRKGRPARLINRYATLNS